MSQIGPKWDKSGTFLRSVSVHFGGLTEPKCTETDLKTHRFVLFGANFDIPERHVDKQ